MTLLSLKWAASLIILSISMMAALASIHIAKKYQRWLSFSDALANGVFIGAALFHMLPDAVSEFQSNNIFSPYLDATLIACVSFILLLLIEKLSLLFDKSKRVIIGLWLIIVTLSIHAFVTGFALGLMNSLSLFSILLIAILVHKSFEIFALVINISKRCQSPWLLKLISFLFTLITPCGILLGSYSSLLFASHSSNILSASFDAIAAGTFFFIGMIHREHQQTVLTDSHHQYSNVLASITGVAVMAVLAIWL
jgi:solute carrier family 39 (zinc transporter), member 1/2/3